MDSEKIGQFIKNLREKNNLTQKEFADKLGVTFQAVSKWENGKNIPDIAILKQMSEDFQVELDEILKGEYNKKDKEKSKYIFYFLIGILLIILVFVFFFFKNQDDYEFKTISSKCSDFKITGSAAYNKEKATIYISNVEFCGKEDVNIYKEMSCVLYEINGNTKTKISSCDKKKNLTLEEFLKEVNISVNHYSSSCKNWSSNNLALEIQAQQEDNKIITYMIPIKLNDTCK